MDLRIVNFSKAGKYPPEITIYLKLALQFPIFCGFPKIDSFAGNQVAAVSVTHYPHETPRGGANVDDPLSYRLTTLYADRRPGSAVVLTVPQEKINGYPI